MNSERKSIKTIKMFDGVKVTTEDEIVKYPDMTVFDEVLKCTDEQRTDIIRLLLMYHTVDLGQFTTDKSRCILDLYSDGIGEEKEEYQCQVCGKYIAEEEGTTTLEGKWVCDKDSCRTLDDDNESHAVHVGGLSDE